ncbi:site-specific integrase [Dyadobacter sp. 676]|uniref:Site-specific integrase n=1 Tax=Dyadobacter sp. 676 TaxID=3088362 RepID=A0AAU8FUW8_9BACT
MGWSISPNFPIRNPNTRRSYWRSATDFLGYCEQLGVGSIDQVMPLHVAALVETLCRSVSSPTVKLRLAAVRHLLDWLATGQVIPHNPAASVKGPRHSVQRGKTPILDPVEARAILDAIDISTDWVAGSGADRPDGL